MAQQVRGLFLGRTCFDVIQVVDDPPGVNHKIRSSRHVTAAGGPSTNAAVCFAALGGTATLLSILGEDHMGSAVLADLTEHGGDAITHVQLAARPGATMPSTIAVHASTGDRSVVSADRPAEQRTAELSRQVRDLLEGPFEFDVVLVDTEEVELALPVLARAREVGVPTVADFGTHRPRLDPLIPLLDCAVVAESYLPDSSPEQILDALRAAGLPYGAVTCGERPLHHYSPEGAGTVTPPHVERVVDTLGAGDFFHGAYAHQIATTGLTPEGHVAALERASQVSALSVAHFGPREWLSHL